MPGLRKTHFVGHPGVVVVDILAPVQCTDSTPLAKGAAFRLIPPAFLKSCARLARLRSA